MQSLSCQCWGLEGNSRQLWTLLEFPKWFGSYDGKHADVAIMSPPNSGSEFFIYKKLLLIVLLAIVDAKLKFIAILQMNIILYA